MSRLTERKTVGRRRGETSACRAVVTANGRPWRRPVVDGKKVAVHTSKHEKDVDSSSRTEPGPIERYVTHEFLRKFGSCNDEHGYYRIDTVFRCEYFLLSIYCFDNLLEAPINVLHTMYQIQYKFFFIILQEIFANRRFFFLYYHNKT